VVNYTNLLPVSNEADADTLSKVISKQQSLFGIDETPAKENNGTCVYLLQSIQVPVINTVSKVNSIRNQNDVLLCHEHFTVGIIFMCSRVYFEVQGPSNS